MKRDFGLSLLHNLPTGVFLTRSSTKGRLGVAANTADNSAKEMFNGENRISAVTRSKETARITYDRISRWYDLLTQRAESKVREVGVQKLRLEEGNTVLGIGFGTGICILKLARSVGSSGMVSGIDISEGMCNIAQARVRAAGLSERVELKCGDAVVVPFKADSVDAILMSFTLELFDTSEIPIVLCQCHKVLRRGGRICVVGMSKKGSPGLAARLYEWAHTRFPNYVDCRPIFVRESLESTGFQVVDSTEMSVWRLPVEIVTAKKA